MNELHGGVYYHTLTPYNTGTKMNGKKRFLAMRKDTLTVTTNVTRINAQRILNILPKTRS